jgi:hypothetical protein
MHPYKTSLWLQWWLNSFDAMKFKKKSKSMCCHGVNIPELTREAFLAGFDAALVGIKGPKKKDRKCQK